MRDRNNPSRQSTTTTTIRPRQRQLTMLVVVGIIVGIITQDIVCNAWITQSSTTRVRNIILTPLRMTVQDEKLLRNEIAERQTNVENDAQYGLPDGAFLEKLDDMMIEPDKVTDGSTTTTTGASLVTETKTTPAAPSSSTTSELLDQMKRITKPRAYPLFVIEKVVEFAEATLADVTKTLVGEEPKPVAFQTTNGSTEKPVNKERLVVLGTGWGGASFVKSINTDLYDVTIISPRNHFVFTPMLAGASVGTVEYRSICEPIREICRAANFLEATATDINPTTNTVTCESVVCDGNSCEIQDFTVQYDKLIVTVGAQTNTFGIKGVKEHCNFLRQVEDARRIRTAIINCFERANLPSLSDEEREHNLTFAVIGAGPTGIEFAAELRDFVEQDGPKYYPNLLKYVRIKVIEASSTILAPFDKELQQEAIQQMNQKTRITDEEVLKLLPNEFRLVELLLESSVQEVGEKIIYLKDGTELPYGLSVWAAGNGPIALTLNLIDQLGPEQRAEQDIARGRLAIDPWMRVIGSEGRILGFGDCTCIASGQLPATAQVASQQGEYLAALLNKKFNFSPPRTSDGIFPPPKNDPIVTQTTLSDAIAGFAINNQEFAKPFQFLNLGILAYTGGGSALAQVTPAPNAPSVKGTGKIGNAVWKSVYLSKQFSMRNRLLVLNDWTKRQLFGRDITRL